MGALNGIVDNAVAVAGLGAGADIVMGAELNDPVDNDVAGDANGAPVNENGAPAANAEILAHLAGEQSSFLRIKIK